MKKQFCVSGEWVIIFFLVFFGFAARLLPHPANFAPIGALALFGGMYLSKRLALILPLGAMFVSDVFIGFYDWRIMLSVYASFFLMGCIGLLVRRQKNIFTIGIGTLSGSLLFFLITNAAVWAFGTMYVPTLAGLKASYIAAIPFFRNSVLGDLFYTGVLVGGFEMVASLMQLKRIHHLKVNPSYFVLKI